MRQLYLTKIRPVFTYACGAWFVRRRQGEGRLHWGLTLDQVNKLNALQTECLRKISGAFGKTSGQVLEKELYVENLYTHLYTQACVQRAKVLLSEDNRWRRDNKPMKKTRPKTPTQLLDQDAAALAYGAHSNLREHAEASNESEAALLRWADEKKRNHIISCWAKKLSTKECEGR
ncbi:hypothetical protein EDB80DRAFT_724694 [Ilyonectria destructans]|nr:hypothetical protein EDB80DRAFT_724694 [Ilyonectria destructans]